MKLSTRNTVDILRKFVQNTINSNNSLLGRLKCESFLAREREAREASPYSRRNGRASYAYSPREPGSERGTRRSHERSSTRERESNYFYWYSDINIFQKERHQIRENHMEEDIDKDIIEMNHKMKEKEIEIDNQDHHIIHPIHMRKKQEEKIPEHQMKRNIQDIEAQQLIKIECHNSRDMRIRLKVIKLMMKETD